jgi:hypothetical protein
MADQEKNIKVWKATPDSPAGFQIEEKAAYMIGSRTNFIAASDVGIVLSSSKGISFNTTSENVRRGALFIEMNDIVKLIPTTLVTPMPAQVPFPPLAMVSNILRDMPFFMSMLNNATGVA